MKAKAVLLALWSSASLAVAAAGPKVFSIEEQSLASALNQFAQQSDRQILFSTEVVNAKRTNGVKGELEPEAALKRLLKGTGLTFRVTADQTILVDRPGDTANVPVPEHSVRLAQAGGAESSPSSEEQASQDSSRNPEKRIELEEIIVTGTNIRGVYPSSSPVETYTVEDIARTGATTTAQFIQKLPQNLGTRTEYASNSGPTINREAISSVDLRGLGVGTTLTLLNGRRLALAGYGQTADVSMIPLSAIARVEVLTDGASAIYGSDAIGGVVNFVLRDDFEGAETRFGYGGVTDGDLRQTDVTQTFGRAWNSGNGLVSFDYSYASALAAADRDYASTTVNAPGDLTPTVKRYGAIATISQHWSDELTVEGDFAFSRRDVRNVAYIDTLVGATPIESETEQYFGNVGADYRIADALNGKVLASYSQVNVDSSSRGFVPGSGAIPRTFDTDYSALDLTAMLDGALFALPAGSVRFSFGADYLTEQYKGRQTLNEALASGKELGRATTSVFGELLLPLVGEHQDVGFVHGLELSLAARYTSYDDKSDPRLGRDFGDGVSPKIGLLWAPFSSLSLRGTYGESFRAPTLAQIDPTSVRSSLLSPSALAPIGGTPATVLSLTGPAPDIEPETADTYTLGFDFRPTRHPAFRISATYFNIDYIDRIGDAAASIIAARQSPSAWPEIIHQPASAAEIENLLSTVPTSFNNTGISLSDLQAASQALLARLPNMWIIESRIRNLAVSKLDGFDVTIGHQFDTASGVFPIGAQVTRILSYEEQASPSSPVTSAVDTVTRPVSLRGRIYGGFTHGGLQNTVNINYVDDYRNPLAVGGAQGKVASWTTVDWMLSYEFHTDAQEGFLDGLKLTCSVQNVFDKDPPLVLRSSTLPRTANFDPANANPLGRMVSLSVWKAW